MKRKKVIFSRFLFFLKWNSPPSPKNFVLGPKSWKSKTHMLNLTSCIWPFAECCLMIWWVIFWPTLDSRENLKWQADIPFKPYTNMLIWPCRFECRLITRHQDGLLMFIALSLCANLWQREQGLIHRITHNSMASSIFKMWAPDGRVDSIAG